MAYDNLCKYLAEQYPQDYARWLLNAEPDNVQVLKSELNLEPIHADSLIFLRLANCILHIEFQTRPSSDPPLPLRMLDYKVRLLRQYRCEIVQVVILLRFTTSELAYNESYQDPFTEHRYRVIRLWEEDPTPFLNTPALLPLAPLTRTNNPRQLLERVINQVARIKLEAQRQSVAACAEVLAGLRFDKTLIQQLFREEIVRESVIYQDILQKGIQQGLQQGRQQEAASLVLRLLTRRFGNLETSQQDQINQLKLAQLEDLSEALLDFSSLEDLNAWLGQA